MKKTTLLISSMSLLTIGGTSISPLNNFALQVNTQYSIDDSKDWIVDATDQTENWIKIFSSHILKVTISKPTFQRYILPQYSDVLSGKVTQKVFYTNLGRFFKRCKNIGNANHGEYDYWTLADKVLEKIVDIAPLYVMQNIKAVKVTTDRQWNNLGILPIF